MITWLINWSKTHFWSSSISSNWIKSEFSISLKADQKWVFEQIETRDHKIRREIGVDQKWNGMHMLHVTYLLHTQNWIKSCTPAYHISNNVSAVNNLTLISSTSRTELKVSFFLTDSTSATGSEELGLGIDKRFFASYSWWSLVSRKIMDFFRKWSMTSSPYPVHVNLKFSTLGKLVLWYLKRLQKVFLLHF